MVTSDDLGRTWSKPRQIALQSRECGEGHGGDSLGDQTNHDQQNAVPDRVDAESGNTYEPPNQKIVSACGEKVQNSRGRNACSKGEKCLQALE